MAISKKSLLSFGVGVLGLGWSILGINDNLNAQTISNSQPITNLEAKINSPNQTKQKLPKANGIVTNIWMDRSYFKKFQAHNIKYIFVDIGDVDKASGLITTPMTEIVSFYGDARKYSKDSNYDFILLPWNVVKATSESDEKPYDFSSDKFRTNFISEYVKLVNSVGFDGILSDVEAIPAVKMHQYVEMMKEFKSKLRPGAIISCYAANISDNKDNVWEWRLDDLKNMSQYVELFTNQTFDIHANDAQSYQSYLEEQVKIVLSAKLSSKWLMSVPTQGISSAEEWQKLERPETAMNLYNSMLKQNDSFLGMSYFATWCMEETFKSGKGDPWKIISDHETPK